MDAYLFQRPSSSQKPTLQKKIVHYSNNISTYRPSSSHYQQMPPHPKYSVKRSSSAMHNVKQQKSPPKNSLNDKYFSPMSNEIPPQFQKPQLNNYFNSSSAIKKVFLPPKSKNAPKKTLILDLDETLVHSSFKTFPFRADISFQIKVEQRVHVVNVLKRPYVHEFLNKMSKLFELVIFTASVSPYANPVLDRLDQNKVISHRLYREHCIKMSDLYIKDLRKVGRSMKDVFLLDNNPISYVLNKENGLPINTWRFEKNDYELMKIIPLMGLLSKVDDVRPVIKRVVKNNAIDYNEVNKVINEYKEKVIYHHHNNIPSYNNEKHNVSSANHPSLSKNININIVNQQVSNVYVNEFRDGPNYRGLKDNPYYYENKDVKSRELNNYFYYNRNNANQPVQINHFNQNYNSDIKQSNNKSSYYGESTLNFYRPSNSLNANAMLNSLSSLSVPKQNYPLASSGAKPISRSFYLQERENNLSFASRNERYHTPLRNNGNSNNPSTSQNPYRYGNSNITNSAGPNYNLYHNSNYTNNSSSLPVRSDRYFQVNPQIRYI